MLFAVHCKFTKTGQDLDEYMALDDTTQRRIIIYAPVNHK